MTREDINNIISAICPNDEDFEKPIISPKYLKTELEQLALEQEPKTESCEDCISRQAAIKYLCTNMNWYNEDGETADDEEKLNAITDLVNGVPPVTQEPKTEPCEDCISRQAVHEAITRWAGSMAVLVALPTREVRPLLDSIHELPPVKPQEPKTGHWKRISIDKYSEHAKYWYRCDRCGKDNLGNTDFCPSCGARMVEQQESEDKE